MDTLLKSAFSKFSTTPRISPAKSPKPLKVKAPPPDFDFRAEILAQSTATIYKAYPQLSDLAESGKLVLIEKRQFGPVPSWRTEFVEPEAIWLMGTNHISPESAVDVQRVVRAVRPDNVVVELCRSRAGIMYTSNDSEQSQQLKPGMFSLSGNGFFDAVGRSINLGGQSALALRLLLAMFSSKISSDVNLAFGDEFRSARKAAEEIGAQLVLGDRPIEITLERAWNSLNWHERVSLVISVVRVIASSSSSSSSSTSDISMKNLTDLNHDETGFQLYEQLSYSFPSLLQPLLHERDTIYRRSCESSPYFGFQSDSPFDQLPAAHYIAWSLKRSKAVNNCSTVVGVIGKGHLNGVIYALISDQGNLRFRDLTGQKSSADGRKSFVGGLVKDLVRDTVIGVLLWALYEQVKGGF